VDVRHPDRQVEEVKSARGVVDHPQAVLGVYPRVLLDGYARDARERGLPGRAHGLGHRDATRGVAVHTATFSTNKASIRHLRTVQARLNRGARRSSLALVSSGTSIHHTRRCGLEIAALAFHQPALASVVLAWERELHPDMVRVNVNAGVIALGHPSEARAPSG
jgi:hypothetical protein